MERYRNTVGKPCTYHELQSSVYRNLPDAAKEYYFYWREMLKKGTLLKHDDNMVELRLKEILFFKEQAIGQLELLCRPDERGNIKYRTALDLLIDQCLLNKRPLPRLMYREPRLCGLIFSEVLASPPEDLTWNMIQSCINVVGSDRNDKILDLMNRSLREYDKALLEKTGSGILDTYFKPIVDVRDTFRQVGLVKKTGPRLVVSMMGYTGIPQFLESLYYASYQEIAGSVTNLSKNDLIWDTVHKVYSENIQSEAPYPEWKYRRISVHRFSECQGKKPVIANTKREPRPGEDFQDRLERIVPSPKYVSSTETDPITGEMSDEVLAFYRYWKESLNKEEYLDTDNGYLLLYLKEVIENLSDREILEKTEEIYENYHAEEFDFIKNEIVASCKIRSGKPVSLEDRHDYRTACMMITDYLEGKTDVEPPAEAFTLSSDQGYKYEMGFEQDSIWLFNRIIRKICDRIRSKGNSIDQTLEVRACTEKTPLFRNLLLHKRKDELHADIRYYDLRNSDKFVKLAFNLNKACKCVVDGKPSEKIVFDRKDWSSIIEETYREEMVRRRSQKEAMTLKLDNTAIDLAESELNDVTKMMNTENSGEQDMEITEKVRESDPIIDYLKAALDHVAKEYAKNNGLNLNRLEDSVNEAAMVKIGDTVVVDGEIVEDYLEEVKEWVRKSTSSN